MINILLSILYKIYNKKSNIDININDSIFRTWILLPCDIGGLFLAAYFHKTSGIYGMKLFIIAALVFVIPLVLLYFCTDFSSIPNPWFAIILIILVTILGVLLILILKKIGFIKYEYE